jgi:hypothetical protein
MLIFTSDHEPIVLDLATYRLNISNLARGFILPAFHRPWHPISKTATINAYYLASCHMQLHVGLQHVKFPFDALITMQRFTMQYHLALSGHQQLCKDQHSRMRVSQLQAQ